MLGLLAASAFFVRLENFKNTELRSIDEIVYYRMAKQVYAEGLSGYNTIPYGKELAAQGRELPDYFFEPLFKHPPVFTLLMVGMFHLIQPSFFVAGSLSILLSSLMIILVYWLGVMIADRRAGMFAAILLWMDPIVIMSSQKIWMDTTIAFFTLLSVCFFVWALKEKRDIGFLLSGWCTGMAVNTKYTGILIVLVYGLHAILYEKELLKNRFFWMGIALPFILLIPWFMWNASVYAGDIIGTQGELRDLILSLKRHAMLGIGLLLGAAAGTVMFLKMRKNKTRRIAKEVNGDYSQLVRYSYIFVGLLIAILLSENIKHSLSPFYIPTNSWQLGFFRGELPTFYFGRLLEYSFLYVFAYFVLLAYSPEEEPLRPVVRLSALVILAFFIVWGNYQSRYVLSAVPFLLILATELIVGLYDRIKNIPNLPLRALIKACLVLLVVYSFYKTMFINLFLSFPNDVCYF